jgi:hypothetical protein
MQNPRRVTSQYVPDSFQRKFSVRESDSGWTPMSAQLNLSLKPFSQFIIRPLNQPRHKSGLFALFICHARESCLDLAPVSIENKT